VRILVNVVSYALGVGGPLCIVVALVRIRLHARARNQPPSTPSQPG
jgi:hypothetical protein